MVTDNNLPLADSDDHSASEIVRITYRYQISMVTLRVWSTASATSSTVLDFRLLGRFFCLVLQPAMVEQLSVLFLLLVKCRASYVEAPHRVEVVVAVLLYAAPQAVDHVSSFRGQEIPHASTPGPSKITRMGAAVAAAPDWLPGWCI